jgi:Tol biopolymer transport system component
MTPERWELLQDLLYQALERNFDTRAAFLDGVTGDDPSLREELESLLKGHDEEGILDGLEEGRDVGQDQFDRVSQALSGRYTVDSEAGRGGMATVYRAKDLKHKRSVAIKVLHPALVHSIGVDRFFAEIETTADLQHPHILPLFDSGEIDGILFYVMPYVEGESLRQHLDREHQLPVEDAVGIAVHMAEALDYAHRRGVIHRDIKPGNVLLQDGQPMIADFGIAIAVGAAREGRLTQAGHSLGTPRYMSPEQVTGDHAVGPASDNYALACVLHEMLVGEPPHVGDTADSVLRKVVRGPTTSPGEVRKSIPPNVDAAIMKGLERLPADRFRSAQNFATALTDPAFRYGSGATVAAPASPWKRLAVALSVLLALVAGLAIGMRTTINLDSTSAVERFALTPRATSAMFDPYIGVGVALSRDGQQLVYVGTGSEGRHLWLRQLDALEPEPIPWTEGADNPVFSPDGSMVAFKEGENIKTVSLRGGLANVIMDEGVTGGYFDWGADGYIYFASDSTISKVPAGGGEPEQVTATFAGARTRLPRVLPDGRGLLVTLRRDAAAQATVGVAGPEGEVRELFPGLSARYARSGHIVYATPDGSLMAAPFDLDRLEVTGESVVVFQGLDVRNPGLGAQFAFSEAGTLVYRTTGVTELYQPVWVDRTGQATPIDPDWSFIGSIDDSGLALSPNDERLAVSVQRDAGGGWDLWMKELDEGPVSRFTREGIKNRRPSWSKNGEFVTYVYDGERGGEIRQKRADGMGDASTLAAGLAQDDGGQLGDASEAFLSPSNEWLVYRAGSTDDGSDPDIFAIRLGVDSIARGLLTGPYVEWAPALSPDGRWLAYTSDETGVGEVYVRPFPDVDSGQHRVSTSGGHNPVWSRSGSELFYRDGSDQLISVQVTLGSTFTFGPPLALFSAANYLRVDGHPVYDVSLDDQRFVMLASVSASESAELVLVRNWFNELSRLVPR